MKICDTCKISKPETEFPSWIKDSDNPVKWFNPICFKCSIKGSYKRLSNYKANLERRRQFAIKRKKTNG